MEVIHPTPLSKAAKMNELKEEVKVVDHHIVCLNLPCSIFINRFPTFGTRTKILRPKPVFRLLASFVTSIRSRHCRDFFICLLLLKQILIINCSLGAVVPW